jgi:hypothetical protein
VAPDKRNATCSFKVGLSTGPHVIGETVHRVRAASEPNEFRCKKGPLDLIESARLDLS